MNKKFKFVHRLVSVGLQMKLSIQGLRSIWKTAGHMWMLRELLGFQVRPVRSGLAAKEALKEDSRTVSQQTPESYIVSKKSKLGDNIL